MFYIEHTVSEKNTNKKAKQNKTNYERVRNMNHREGKD